MLTWKVRFCRGRCMTHTFSRDDVPAHFIHAFKEMAMQRFFRGSSVLDGWADIPPPAADDDDDSEAGTIVFLDKTEGHRADSLRHHICFIMPASAAISVMNDDCRAALQNMPQGSFSGGGEARRLLRADTLRRGEFNMVASWEGSMEAQLLLKLAHHW